MEFIKPKFKHLEKTDWKISQKSKLIIEYYAKYTGYSEDEVVDKFLMNLLEDSDFLDFLKKRRSKKKINKFIFCQKDEEVSF